MKLDIIIPVYNVEKYIANTLESLCEQTFKLFNVIIINDGSKENEKVIIKKFMDRLNIKYIEKENGGQASARNIGLKQLTSKYVMFLDSDDYLEKNALELLVKEIEKKEMDIVCFNFNKIYNEKTEKYIPIKFGSNDMRLNYIISDPSPCNKIFKSSLFLKNNISFLENRIYEDLAIIPSLAIYTDKISYMDKELYNYVIHENSTMRQTRYNNKLKDIFFVMEHIKEKFNEKFKEEIEYVFIEHLLHGATLRFIKFDESEDDLFQISRIMKSNFPNFRKNKYFKQENIKYKIVCYLAFSNNVKILKRVLRGK